MGGAPRLGLGSTTQYPDGLLLTHEIGPHAGQHITHKIIVADQPDTATFDSSPLEQSSHATTDDLTDLLTSLPRVEHKVPLRVGCSEIKEILTHPKVELVTSSFQTILGSDLAGSFARIDVEQNRQIRHQAGRRPARELANLGRSRTLPAP